MPAPAIRALFFRSTYDAGGLAQVVDAVCTVIRKEGLRPDVVARDDLVTVYARPKRTADAAAPELGGA